MDPVPQGWRTVGDAPELDGPSAAGGRSDARGSTGARWSTAPLILALVLFSFGLVVSAAVVLVAWSSAPPEVVIDGANVVGLARPAGSPATTGGPVALPVPAAGLVIDVEGAVDRPGLYRVLAGSRVGDAIAAAGGFGARVDVGAASRSLNLASPLSDGDKVHVPALGEVVGAEPANGVVGGASTAPGLIDLNTAGTMELESLPGIGPVTAAAIIAARETSPFVSVDDLRSRSIVGPSTFESLRHLVTVGG